MDFGNIWVFIALFVTILLVLIGIAYYGMPEKTYDDVLKEKGIKLGESHAAGAGAEAKKKSKKEASKNKNQQQKKKPKKTEMSTNEDSDESGEEEEEMIAVPDPFTNKVFSRFGTNVGKNYNVAPSVAAVVAPPLSSSVNQQQAAKIQAIANRAVQSVNRERSPSQHSASGFQQLKEKPKAAVKPNQTKAVVVAPVASARSASNEVPKKTIAAVATAKPAVDQDVKVTAFRTLQSAPVAAPVEVTIRQIEQKMNAAIHDKEKTIGELNNNNAKLKHDLEKLTAHLSDYDTHKATNSILQREMTKLTQKSIAVEKEKITIETKLRAEIERLQVLEASLIEKLNAAQIQSRSVGDNNDNVKILDNQISKLVSKQVELSELKARLKDSNAAYENQVKTLAGDLQSKEKTIQAINKDLESVRKALELKDVELAEKTNSKDVEIKLLNEQIAKLNTDLEKLKHSNSAKEGAENELASKNNQLNERDAKITNLESELKSKASHLEALTTEIQAFKARIQEFEANGKTAEGIDTELNQKLNDATAKVNELTQSLQAKEDKNHQLEDSLNELNQKLNDTNSKLNELNQQVQSKDDVIRKNEESIKSVELVKTELETNKRSLSESLAQLQVKYESLLSSNGSTADDTSKEIVSLKEQLSSINKDLEIEKAKNSELSNTTKSVNESLDAFRKTSESELAQKESSVKSLSEQIEQLKTQQKNELAQKLSDKDTEIKKLNMQIEELNTVKNKELTDATSKLNASIKEIEQKQSAEIKAKITEKDAQIKNLTEQITGLKNQSKSGNADKDRLIENLQKELKDESGKLANLQQFNLMLIKETKDRRSDETLKSNDADLVRFQEEAKSLKDELKRLRDELEQQKNKNNEKINSLSESLDAAKEENDKLKLANTQLKEILKSTEANIFKLESYVKLREEGLISDNIAALASTNGISNNPEH